MEESGTPARVIERMADLEGLVEQELGVGRWLELTQPMVDAFADLTDDHQWIHVDTERAARSAFGATIAHGFLLLSLLPRLSRDREGIRVAVPRKMAINYGLDRVRFITPVPVGRRIRLRTRLASLKEVRPSVHQIVYQQTVELEGSERPALVADAIQWWYL